MARKYKFNINDKSFNSARRALAHWAELRKKRESVNTISVNGDLIAHYTLEQEARSEAAEAAHNKRQGL